MAIDPNNITTVRVGQLPPEVFNLTDNLPHEVGTDLKQGTVQQLADVIGSYLEVSGGVGFRAVSVADGETLPETSSEEFILVGAGTFFNVGGGADITTTQELNVLVSNGTYWFIGVEIDVSVSLSDYITQFIRTGFTNTAPSEDAVFNALAEKLSISDFEDFADNLPIDQRVEVNDINYNISGTGSQLIAYTAITADRTVSLPPAVTPNQRIWITDESGLCSNVRRIIVAPDGTDVIGGDSFAVVNFPNGSGYFECNGSGRWNIISTTSIQYSAGVNTMPSITDNGDGSVTIGTGVYSLYANTGGQGRPKAYQAAGGTFTLTDQSSNWIIATYNTTTGTVAVSSVSASTSINNITVIPIFKIFRDGTALHIGNYDTLGLALSNKMQRSFEKTQPYRFELGGVLIGELATRIITISSGNIWSGGNEIPLTAVASNTHTCYQFVNTAGTWSKSVVTQYNNTQYNAAFGLVTLSNTNSYAVNYVFRSVGTDTDFAFVLGTGDYTLGQAQTAPIPSNLPTFITEHMVFVGRIIVQKNINTATQIDSANTTGALFTSAGVTDHEALNNLLGGAANDHYHLTLAQHTTVTKPAGSILKTRKDISGSYTLLSSDVDKILYAAASTIITVPSGLTTNQEYEIFQSGAGTSTIITSGTTLRMVDYAIAATYGQYGRVLLSWIDTETYSLFGDLQML